MNKKKFYIITTCCIVALLIVFEIVMYYAVGEEILLKKGPIRYFWLGFPAIVFALSFVRDYIIKRKYENDDNK